MPLIEKGVFGAKVRCKSDSRFSANETGLYTAACTSITLVRYYLRSGRL